MSKIYCNRKTKDKKTTYIRSRCTKSEKILIENHAKLKGMTVSDYIMNLIVKDTNGEQCK
ncbi:hypothetical protein AALJ34_17210 [Paraclostridium bifermentans]|uniref:plasmid mobilization protein n=1 Tax=Paraclostridium bifermentans TaxID=1490 RepID=UPI001C1128D4|nr:hypothetical protein [Paraclostridium bifermentans]MBU5290098.1 hypothetical protein [Paraclostridium bifermentans]